MGNKIIDGVSYSEADLKVIEKKRKKAAAKKPIVKEKPVVKDDKK